MYLFKKRIKGVRIEHPLGKRDDLSDGLEDWEVNKIEREIRVGNLDGVSRLVNGYSKLIISIASQYANYAEHKADDIVSVAMMALVQACNEFAQGKGEELISYIITRVHTKCKRFICSDSVIGVPETTFKRTGKRVNVQPISNDREANNSEVFELMDEILGACNDDRDRAVIELRSYNYTDKEIGKILRMSHVHVNRIRRAIERRFEMRRNEKA